MPEPRYRINQTLGGGQWDNAGKNTSGQHIVAAIQHELQQESKVRFTPFGLLLGLSSCYVNPPVPPAQQMIQAPPAVVVERPQQQPPQVVIQQPSPPVVYQPPQPPAVVYR